MKPYYSDELVTLFHGDCLEVADWLDADVLVTDPPYGTQFSTDNPKGGYGRRQNAGLGPEGFVIANDGTTETRDAALALWGVTAQHSYLVPPDCPTRPAIGPTGLVWDKKRPGMNGGPWPSDAAVSILTAFPEQGDHIHGKPLALMETLVAAAPLGVIADPFAGSCTTLVAAHHLGRQAIGVEIDERYCELLATRLSQGTFDFGSPVDEVRSSGWSGTEQEFDFGSLVSSTERKES